MAIALDTNSTGTTVGVSTTLTISHTVASGAGLVVAVQADAGVAPDSVTFNGVSLSLGREVNGGLHASCWYIGNPASGTHDIIVTYSVARHMTAEGTSFTGADSSFLGATNVGTGTTNDAAISVTTTRANSWIISSTFHNRNSSQTAITNSTIQGNVYNATDNFRGLLISRSTTTAGSYSLGETMGTASDGWAIAAMEVKEPNPNYTISAAVGAFTLTGQNITITLGATIIAAVGTFVVTMQNFVIAMSGWTNQTKHVANYNNEGKHTSIWVDLDKS